METIRTFKPFNCSAMNNKVQFSTEVFNPQNEENFDGKCLVLKVRNTHWMPIAEQMESADYSPFDHSNSIARTPWTYVFVQAKDSSACMKSIKGEVVKQCKCTARVFNTAFRCMVM